MGLVTLGLIVLICMPGIVAAWRRHPWTAGISVASALVWWTVIGWAICMAIAFTDVDETDEEEGPC